MNYFLWVCFMNKIRVLIADHDVRFTDYIVNALKIYPEIEVHAAVDNGIDALREVKSTKIDALVFDLLLPGLDGITLLRSVNEIKNPPATLCCTRFYSDVALEATRSYGASYVLYKPLDAHVLYTAILYSTNSLQKVKQMQRAIFSANADSEKLRMYVRNFIVTLGVPSKLIGCSYLTEAVLLAKNDAMLIRNLSRGLYLEVARIMRTTPNCVERSIRNAISNAHCSHSLPDSFLQCPSNKEFIRYVLQNLTFQ